MDYNKKGIIIKSRNEKEIRFFALQCKTALISIYLIPTKRIPDWRKRNTHTHTRRKICETIIIAYIFLSLTVIRTSRKLPSYFSSLAKGDETRVACVYLELALELSRVDDLSVWSRATGRVHVHAGTTIVSHFASDNRHVARIVRSCLVWSQFSAKFEDIKVLRGRFEMELDEWKVRMDEI